MDARCAGCRGEASVLLRAVRRGGLRAAAGIAGVGGGSGLQGAVGGAQLHLRTLSFTICGAS